MRGALKANRRNAAVNKSYGVPAARLHDVGQALSGNFHFDDPAGENLRDVDVA